MPYESGFLNKCRQLASSHLEGKLALPDFAKKVEALYASRQEAAERIMDVCQDPEYVDASSRGVDLGGEGLEKWERGFRCWFEYVSGSENGRMERSLVEEGLEKMKEGNDLLNMSRDQFLDAAEEDFAGGVL